MAKAARELAREESTTTGLGLRVKPSKRAKAARKGRGLSVVQGGGGDGSRADTAPMEYARCRSLGHTWMHRNTPFNPKEDGGSWYHQSGMAGFVSVCSSCATKRTKWVMRSGTLGTTSYDYPDGYSTHGEERLSGMEWRRSFVVRVFGD